MASRRRAALLKPAWLVVASGIAASAVLVPLGSQAILPGPGDIGVGWCLLAGAALATRRPLVALCLGLGGVLWVVVGLAPLGPDALEEPLARLALLPTALLACAAGCLSVGRHRRLVVVSGAVALGMAALAAAGAPRFSLLGIAVAALVVPVVAPGGPGGVTALQLGLGAGLLVVGLDEAGLLALPVDLSVAFHLLVLACGAVSTGWLGATGVRLGVRVSPDGPLELGRALGRALGTGDVVVEFPAQDGGWLDPAGRPCRARAAFCVVTDQEGRALARTQPALVVPRGALPDLHRFLRAAGDGARLRAVLRERAGELASSRARLVSAAEDERRRLVFRLEVGPLRRLERISQDLSTRADGTTWTARTAVARRTLDGLVCGLDPVDDEGGLIPALAGLADAAGAPMVVIGPVPVDLDPSAGRAVWFACAEALANARKHAAGSVVTVALDTSDDIVLTVADDGPGGADAGAAGLCGLADRLALVGGSLEVITGVAGTTVAVRVPARKDVLAPPGGPVQIATGDP